MTDTQDTNGLIAELTALYDSVKTLRQQWEDLQALSQVQAAVDGVLGQVTRHKEFLQREVNNLSIEKGRLLQPKLMGPQETLIDGGKQNGQSDENDWLTDRTQTKGPTEIRPDPEREARKKLDWIRRFAQRLGSEDNQHRINQILSDYSQPRGAALFLITNWDAFTSPLPNEKVDTSRFIDRLRDSRDALLEYQERLKADIDAVWTRYGGLRGIWELWLTRREQPELWTEVIAKMQVEAQSEVTRLQSEKSRLEKELADLRAQSEERVQ
jgi:peptidoglycan hydrolase CwlO-like protein